MKYISHSDAVKTYALFFLLTAFSFCDAVGQKLYIYIPTEYTPLFVAKKFREKYRNYTIRSFGYVTDFQQAVSVDTPDAVITKPQLIPFLDIYNIRLNATFNGRTKEPFYIISVDKPLTLVDLENKRIGILDFLGRKNISILINDLVGMYPKLTRVKKIEDLIPLLAMNMVDGIIASASQVTFIKGRSRLKLHETTCNIDQGIAVLAVLKESDEIVSRIKALPSELALMIGVDGWK